MVERAIGEADESEDWDLDDLNHLLLPIIPIEEITKEDAAGLTKDQLKQKIKEKAVALYAEKEAQFESAEQIREIERVILLRVIDEHWMNHIDDMEQLRQGIGLVGYGQRDPKVEYKMAAYDMFSEMTESIQQDTIRLLYHLRVEEKVEREEVAKVTGTNRDDTSKKKPVTKKAKKIYPNDPCPCGSGLKYKQCHGRKGAPPLPDME